ncbi:methyltransferase family protein [Cognatishimia maritima]|uniref:Protein-S-isoprenylcysteine O-methyltransferase Ste14 n=1 Tax=Cognatishimia maritima TaxID=870908 RepID=A0A1M5JSC6_9RHOB|nr:isoprenylcysteine carboxylmethyltransferase family protein [Cognatishimia maritima]SHG43461.1 Protein-S-isoprenylcysteine O-methyltransferase Ste14 [Cognatishimia maritima]
MSNAPDIKLYPPYLALAAPISAVALDWALPLGWAFPGPIWQIALGLALACAALWLAVAGARAFKSAGTNIDPKDEALVLVEAGPYRLTRNPMYLGMVTLQLALAFLFSLEWSLMIAPFLWLALDRGVVIYEETYLSHKFGAPYDAYLARTRRWL